MTDTETAACEKCDSQISVNADRCPQCGHEPGANGIIATILILLGLGNVGLMGLIFVVIWIVAATGGLSLTDTLSTSVGVLVLSLPGLVILYLAALSERKTPTGRMKSWREVWEGAQSD